MLVTRGRMVTFIEKLSQPLRVIKHSLLFLIGTLVHLLDAMFVKSDIIRSMLGWLLLRRLMIKEIDRSSD